MESPISDSDVTTIMRLLADMRDDIRAIRWLLEEDGEEEEGPENHA